ncbi:MAG: hypothetical protein KatS3mg129_1657 [Leptospiraceae bacterium]|nr:MAG: hypothetical protein KatS3mg129_1657 [Leptospiraceae bacterium]
MDKPNILISACLNQEKVRYNGLNIQSPHIEKMRNYVNFINICPEVEIGLGIPREESKLLKENDKFYFIYTKDNKDYTQQIEDVFFKVKDKIFFGVVLKSKSPSCGINSANYYKDRDFKNPIGKTNGIFANKLLQEFPYIPFIDDGRLNDEILNYEFWTKVFCYYEFYKIKGIEDLINFHSNYKFLFYSFSLKWAKNLGIIIGNHKKDFNKTLKDYNNEFIKLSKLRYKITLDINVMFHLFGYFSNKINYKEKQYFLTLIDKFRHRKINRKVLIELFRIYCLRFENPYLLRQKYFNPFPEY